MAGISNETRHLRDEKPSRQGLSRRTRRSCDIGFWLPTCQITIDDSGNHSLPRSAVPLSLVSIECSRLVSHVFACLPIVRCGYHCPSLPEGIALTFPLYCVLHKLLQSAEIALGHGQPRLGRGSQAIEGLQLGVGWTLPADKDGRTGPSWREAWKVMLECPSAHAKKRAMKSIILGAEAWLQDLGTTVQD